MEIRMAVNEVHLTTRLMHVYIMDIIDWLSTGENVYHIYFQGRVFQVLNLSRS